MALEVGMRYLDRRGEYSVIAIRGNEVTYRYGDGVEASAPQGLKARIHANIMAERAAVHPHSSADYFRALGFMARHAELNAEVPPQARPGFEEKYFISTGEKATARTNGYSPVEIETTYDKWGAELRVYIPETIGQMSLGADIEIRSGASPGILRVNNNAFWWRLVGIGFRLGKGPHRIEKIRTTVPQEFLPNFDAGLAASD